LLGNGSNYSFDPEDGGDMFLRNVGCNSTDYTASYISGFPAGRLFCLPPAYLLVLAEIISSTLKMEAISYSETSVATQQATRRHIPEDDTLQ
jgi:hypothetical protein